MSAAGAPLHMHDKAKQQSVTRLSQTETEPNMYNHAENKSKWFFVEE